MTELARCSHCRKKPKIEELPNGTCLLQCHGYSTTCKSIERATLIWNSEQAWIRDYKPHEEALDR